MMVSVMWFKPKVRTVAQARIPMTLTIVELNSRSVWVLRPPSRFLFEVVLEVLPRSYRISMWSEINGLGLTPA